MVYWFRVLFAAVIFCFAPHAFAELQAFGLSQAQVKAVQNGELVVMKFTPENNAGVSFQAVKRMDVSPQKLRPVLRECQHFHEFMPHTLKSKMTKRNGNTAVCEMVVDMPFPFDDLRSVVDSKWGETKPGVWRRSWTLIKGSFHRNMGSWTVLNGPSPNTAYAVYKASVDPKISIPDLILRKAQVNSIPNLMKAVLERAKSGKSGIE